MCKNHESTQQEKPIKSMKKVGSSYLNIRSKKYQMPSKSERGIN